MYSDEVVISVRGLSKRYEIYATPRDRLKQLLMPKMYAMLPLVRSRYERSGATPPKYFRDFWALRDVSFQVRKGETVGVVGLNGSGKSTLLQLICSTLNPTSGDIKVNGRIAALLELGSGFNPDFTGRENVFLNGQVLGLTREVLQERFRAIEEFADIGSFIDQPIKTYSSGMVVRLAFAVAINVAPDILVVDEALAVGDLAFQRKCLRWMEDFAAHQGVLLFVSHSPEQVRRLCNKAIYLRHGELAGIGDAKEICELYERDLYSSTGKNDGDHNIHLADHQCTSSLDVANLSPEKSGFVDCAMHYGGDKVRITGAWIEDSSGRRINSLQVGERFCWCYSVVSSIFVDQPIFGFMVKTKEGVNLYSANSRSLGHDVKSLSSGSLTLVRFFVEPNLGPGEYFFNCGVSVESFSDIDFLHRVVDAGFLSVSTIDGTSVGLVDLQAKCMISELDQTTGPGVTQ